MPWPLSIECRRSRPAALRWRPRPTPLPFLPLHFQAEDDVCSAALCRIVSRPRPCGDGALWEIWAVGASHAGGSSSSGHSAAAVPAGDDGRGISVLCLFQRETEPGPGGTGEPETTLNSPWGHWAPSFHNIMMGLCGRPRGDPQCLETFRARARPGHESLT